MAFFPEISIDSLSRFGSNRKATYPMRGNGKAFGWRFDAGGHDGAMEHPADRWRDELRQRLLAARKDRDAIRVSTYRSALSSIDNAEVPDSPRVTDGEPSDVVVGAVTGLGSAEVPRKQLTDTEIRGLLRAEIDERLVAAEQLAAGGADERAEVVRAEAAILAEVLGDV